MDAFRQIEHVGVNIAAVEGVVGAVAEDEELLRLGRTGNRVRTAEPQ